MVNMTFKAESGAVVEAEVGGVLWVEEQFFWGVEGGGTYCG